MRVFICSASALVLAFTLSAGPTAQGAPPAAPQGQARPRKVGCRRRVAAERVAAGRWAAGQTPLA